MVFLLGFQDIEIFYAFYCDGYKFASYYYKTPSVFFKFRAVGT